MFYQMISKVIDFSVSCIDTSAHLGRFDYDSLPQQALMEMLIEGIENREKLFGSNEEPKDISKWERVTFNEIGEVIKINWSCYFLQGSVNLECLPSTIRELDLWKNSLTGTISLRNLPKNLKHMSVSMNKLDGSLNLENLPKSLKELIFHVNKFTGEINLTKLPVEMEYLNVSHNQLTGSIDVTSLRASIKYLYLNNNNFEGETDFSKLPESLQKFRVSNNTNLSGEIHDFKGRILRVENSNVKDMSK